MVDARRSGYGPPVRQLLPLPVGDVDPVEAYAVERPAPAGRPWLLLDMVTTLDGATAAAGRSGGLSGPGDRRVFHALRAAADVILVGAGTVRAERYGPPRVPDELQEQRVLRGQAPQPRIAIISRRLELDLESDLFGSTPPPLVVTCPGAPATRRVEVADRADLVLAGQGDAVDLGAALATFHELGAAVVVCEGGPRLNGQLVDADLVDEYCLTVAPLVVGGTSTRSVVDAADVRRGFALAHLLEEGGELFLRAVRDRSGDEDAGTGG
jgi:riboflavin-specific deaminase-like protein